MSLFWKSSSPKPEKVETKNEPAEPLPQPPVTQQLTAEEIARRWFEQKTGSPMPEEIKTWFKSLARLEAQKAKTGENLLDSQQLLKLQEARRLCETKLANAEESLKNIGKQLDWLRRFTQLTGSLEQNKAHLYDVNKHYAAIMTQARELERFETFEAIQGRFQRIQTLTAEQEDNKRMQAETVRLLEAASRRTGEAQKQLELEQEKRSEAEKRLYQMQDALAEGYRIKGTLNILDIERDSLEKRLGQLKQERITLQKERTELEQEISRLTDAITRKSFQRQTLGIHQQMLEKGEVIQFKLDTFLDAKNKREHLQAQLERSIRKQNEQNETLNRLFLQHQDLDSQIRILQNELQVHRQSNFSQDSYSLQKRAMELKGRKQQLLSALSLWRRIASGYAYIDEKNQQITRLRLHVDHEAQNISQLETDIKKLRGVCEEKKYAYTLSKSQNVIQLRSDLREGTSCSVCGATHHPYHSDTMLEQSKLISEMKTDYELIAAELKNKEELLEQMQLKHAEERGCLQTELAALAQVRDTHEWNIKEWAQYSKLDRSFSDCSSSTNMEAREIMLKQLIEKIGQDAEEAQKELDVFNYHQTSINQINEQISQKEATKNDIIVRLNEVNTGCQVMAGQVEQQQQRIGKANEKYSRLYEELDKLITFPDWYNDWTANPENLRIRIQQQMEKWAQLNRDIQTEQTETDQKKLLLQAATDTVHTLEQRIATLEEDLAAVCNLQKEHTNTYQKLFGSQRAKDAFIHLHQAVVQAQEQEQRQADETLQAQKEKAELQGALQALRNTGINLEQRLVEERSELDLWIRKFNANHPPVQYAELEYVFTSGKEWGTLRTEIRDLKIELALTQAKVDEIQSALIAHQAESTRPSVQNTTDTHASLIAQQEELEKKRKEVLRQIAIYDARQQAHERAVEQMNLYRRELNEKLNA